MNCIFYILGLIIFLLVILSCCETFSNQIKESFNNNTITKYKFEKRENLIFTSAGNKNNISQWLKTSPNLRNWNIAVVYYGNDSNKIQKLRDKVDYFWENKGTKFPNLKWARDTQNLKITNWESVWVVDDDIIINSSDINKLFDYRNKLNALVVAPSFINGRIDHPITRHVPGNFYRYTNFIEENVPCFESNYLNSFLNSYDPAKGVLAYGLDFMFLQHIYKQTDAIAIIDDIKCTNPWHKQKEGDNIRELEKTVGNDEIRRQKWIDFMKKYNYEEWHGEFKNYKEVKKLT